MHSLGKICLGGLCDQMVMIVHQTVSMDDDVVTNRKIFKVSQESFSIPVGGKNGAFFITPLDDVIVSSRVFDPQWPRNKLFLPSS